MITRAPQSHLSFPAYYRVLADPVCGLRLFASVVLSCPRARRGHGELRTELKPKRGVRSPSQRQASRSKPQPQPELCAVAFSLKARLSPILRYTPQQLCIARPLFESEQYMNPVQCKFISVSIVTASFMTSIALPGESTT